jgi:hypothetical protein
MDLLLEGKRIDIVANNIVYNTVKKRWDIYDEGNVFRHAVKGDFYILVENVELPTDYEDGKYYYDDGKFVLVADWKPYVSPEERITQLETENADSIEIEADLMYELALMQLGLI